MNRLSKKYKSHIFCLLIAIVAVTVFSGFAIVWLQQQISRTAQRSQKIESEISELDRKLNYTNGRIAKIHQPIVLQSKVADTLRPSLENQIVWVRERKTTAGRSYAALLPYSESPNLAFLDLTTQR